jgi:hypothetical protein
MKFKHVLLSLATAVSFATPAFATPIPFTISSITIAPKSDGYGAIGNDALDVVFTPVSAPINFSLDLAVPSSVSNTFKVGSIDLKEDCIDPGSCTAPKGNETKNLDVLVTFSFTSPLTGNQFVTLTGSATPGPVNDDQPDYSLTFGDPILVAFGNKGQFSLDVLDLTFVKNGPLNLQATVTLLKAPQVVPEPASLALMGVGLAGLALRSKRRKA